MVALDAGNIALCAIISLQFAIAAGLVIYLLLRPRDKKHEKDPRLEPGDEVYTNYGDVPIDGKNGHIAITVQEEDDDDDEKEKDKKSLSSLASSETPKKQELDVDDVKISIEDDTLDQKAPEPDVDSLKEDDTNVPDVKPEIASISSSDSSDSSDDEEEKTPDDETQVKEEEKQPDEVEFIITKTAGGEDQETQSTVTTDTVEYTSEERAMITQHLTSTTETTTIVSTSTTSEVEEQKLTQTSETRVSTVDLHLQQQAEEIEEGKDVVAELPSVATKDDSSSSSSSSDDDEEKGKTTILNADFNSEERKNFRNITTFQSGWKKRVTLEDLYQAKIITTEQAEKLERGETTTEEIEKSIEVYLVGLQPIAGLLMAENGEKVTLYDAWKRGYLRRGTAVSLLEAQAATGRILNPVNGDKMSVAEASQVKLIDRQFQAVLARAERAVMGYKTRRHPEPLSLFEAMQQGLVIENHGIRLLEAQIATGGIIDPKANHRLDVEMAFERNLFDKRLHDMLEDPSDDTRGFFDPNTEENLTYLELMHRCVIDKDTGFRLLPFAAPVKEVGKSEATSDTESEDFLSARQSYESEFSESATEF